MYGEFMIIYNLAKELNKDFDDIYCMSWQQVNTLLDIGKKLDYIQSKSQELKRKLG